MAEALNQLPRLEILMAYDSLREQQKKAYAEFMQWMQNVKNPLGPYVSPYGNSPHDVIPTAEQILEQILSKLADELGFAYIKPDLTEETRRLFREGKIDAIKIRYVDMLRYFSITKDMMRI